MSWPAQNGADIVKEVRTLLRARGLVPLSEQLIAPASACGSNPQCVEPGQTPPQFARLTQQSVMQTLVTPESRYNLLARHDVGSGKSCVGSSVAHNFYAAGRPVFWVSRGSLRSTLEQDYKCFNDAQFNDGLSDAERLAAVRDQRKLTFFTYMQFYNFIHPTGAKIRKHAHLKGVPVRDGRKPTKGGLEFAQRMKLHPDDFLRDALLIIDEPHLMQDLGGLKGQETAKDLFDIIEHMVNHSYRTSGKNRVTVLLLDATPVTDNLTNGARVINLLIPQQSRKLPLGDALEQALKSRSGTLLDLARGYISNYNASTDKTRFADVTVSRITVTPPGAKSDAMMMTVDLDAYAVQGDDADELNDDDEDEVKEDKDETKGKAKAKAKGKGKAKAKKEKKGTKKEQLDDLRAKGPFEDLLQYECTARMSKFGNVLAKRTNNRKLAQCYFEKGDTAGVSYLPKAYRDQNLVSAPEKLRKEFIGFAERLAPKVTALYENIVRLDQENTPERYKHFIFSGSQKYTTSVGTVAALFAAHGHPRLEIHLGASGSVSFKRSGGEAGKDAYVLITQAQSLGGSSAISGSNATRIFKYLNARPQNVHGERARYIILDSKFKEGVSLYDIKFGHLLEPQLNESNETQALGRMLRMCGQCKLQFVPRRGWQVRAFIYDLRATRVPPFAPDYKEPEEKRKGVKEVGSYASACVGPCKTYGEYVRDAITDPEQADLFRAFTELLNAAAIDEGFYTLGTLDEIAERYETLLIRKSARPMLLDAMMADLRRIARTLQITRIPEFKLDARLSNFGSARYMYVKSQPYIQPLMVPHSKYLMAYHVTVRDERNNSKVFDGMGVALLNQRLEVERDYVSWSADDIHEARIQVRAADDIALFFVRKKRAYRAQIKYNFNTGHYVLERIHVACDRGESPWTYLELRPFRLLDQASCVWSEEARGMPMFEQVYQMRVTGGTNLVRWSAQSYLACGVAEVPVRHLKRDLPLDVLLGHLELAKHVGELRFMFFLEIERSGDDDVLIVQRYSDFYLVTTGAARNGVAATSLSWTPERDLLVSYQGGKIGALRVRREVLATDMLRHPVDAATEKVLFIELCVDQCAQQVPADPMRISERAKHLLVLVPVSRPVPRLALAMQSYIKSSKVGRMEIVPLDQDVTRAELSEPGTHLVTSFASPEALSEHYGGGRVELFERQIYSRAQLCVWNALQRDSASIGWLIRAGYAISMESTHRVWCSRQRILFSAPVELPSRAEQLVRHILHQVESNWGVQWYVHVDVEARTLEVRDVSLAVDLTGAPDKLPTLAVRTWANNMLQWPNTTRCNEE